MKPFHHVRMIEDAKYIKQWVSLSSTSSLQNHFGPLLFIWDSLAQSCFNHILFIPDFVDPKLIFLFNCTIALMMVLRLKNKWMQTVTELV